MTRERARREMVRVLLHPFPLPPSLRRYNKRKDNRRQDLATVAAPQREEEGDQLGGCE